MMDIFTYKVIYFAVALLFGFIIGYYIRKNHHEKEIKKQLQELENRHNKTNKQLNQKNEKLIESNNRLKINTDLLETQKKVSDDIKDDIHAIKQKTIALQELKQTLLTDLENIKKQISYYEEQIEQLRPEYSKIEDTVKSYEELKATITKLTNKEKELEKKIGELEAKKETNNDLMKNLKDKNDKFIIDIQNLEEKIRFLEDAKKRYISKESGELEKRYEELNVKLINYKYKVEEIENKLASNQSVDIIEIDNFIEKNENKSFFGKFLARFKTKDRR